MPSFLTAAQVQTLFVQENALNCSIFTPKAGQDQNTPVLYYNTGEPPYENEMKVIFTNNLTTSLKVTAIEIEIGQGSGSKTIISESNLEHITLRCDEFPDLKKSIQEGTIIHISPLQGDSIPFNQNQQLTLHLDSIITEKETFPGVTATINISYKEESGREKSTSFQPTFDVLKNAPKKLKDLLEWQFISSKNKVIITDPDSKIELGKEERYGDIENSLTLELLGKASLLKPREDTVQIFARVVTTKGGIEPGVLCSDDQSKEIHITPQDPKWRSAEDITHADKRWILKPSEAKAEEDILGGSLQFDLKKIVTYSPKVGGSFLYLTFTGLPGYREETVALLVNKVFPEATVKQFHTNKTEYYCGENIIVGCDLFGSKEGWNIIITDGRKNKVFHGKNSKNTYYKISAQEFYTLYTGEVDESRPKVLDIMVEAGPNKRSSDGKQAGSLEPVENINYKEIITNSSKIQLTIYLPQLNITPTKDNNNIKIKWDIIKGKHFAIYLRDENNPNIGEILEKKDLIYKINIDDNNQEKDKKDFIIVGDNFIIVDNKVSKLYKATKLTYRIGYLEADGNYTMLGDKIVVQWNGRSFDIVNN